MGRETHADSVGLSRRTTLAAGVALAVLVSIPLGMTPAGLAKTGGVTPEGVPAFGHVFLIIGENTDYSHLTATNAPFLLDTIRPASAWFTNYYAATHWSQANYVALVTGQFTRCEQQDYGIACHQNVDNLFHQLDAAGRTWKVWLEGTSGRCDFGGSICSSDTPCPLTGFYTTGNPPILFDNVEGPNGVWSPTAVSQECRSNDVPAGNATAGMAYLNANLTSGRVADFNIIIPNGCEDGEANCAPIYNRYTQFDDFLAREVPLIESSPAFGSNGVILILYDEAMREGGMAAKNGLGQGGHTVCAMLTPLVVPGADNDTTYSYSVLRTLEDGFSLPVYLGASVDVSPLPVVWT